MCDAMRPVDRGRTSVQHSMRLCDGCRTIVRRPSDGHLAANSHSGKAMMSRLHGSADNRKRIRFSI